MKLYEIQHINEEHNPRKVMGEELRFTHSIGNVSGKMYPAEKQPKDWQHVRRLSHMLFLAWNDSNPIEPTVYVGEFYTPNHPDFFTFFESHNGFGANDAQRQMYKMYTKSSCGNTIKLFPRRSGVTVFLHTLAAYEAYCSNTKVVVFYSDYQQAHTARHNFQQLCTGSAQFPREIIDKVSFRKIAHDASTFIKSYDLALYDYSSDKYKTECTLWPDVKSPRKFALGTY